MVAERLCSVAKQRCNVWDFGGRRGVFSAAPAFENVAALNACAAQVPRFARCANQVLGARIVWLQVVVGNAPIFNRVVGGQFRWPVLLDSARAQREGVRQETRKPATPMFTSTADARTWEKSSVLPKRDRTLSRGVPHRDGLFGKILHHTKTERIEFIHFHRVVFGAAGAATLQ